MRWVSKTESRHTGTDRSYRDSIQRRQWNYGRLRADRARSSRNDEAALTKTDTICGREAGTRRSQNRRRDVMRQQHAVVGAAIPLPCENERRRSLGAERECEVCRLGGRAAIDSGSHGGGGGLVGGSTATLFGIWRSGECDSQTRVGSPTRSVNRRCRAALRANS